MEPDQFRRHRPVAAGLAAHGQPQRAIRQRHLVQRPHLDARRIDPMEDRQTPHSGDVRGRLSAVVAVCALGDGQRLADRSGAADGADVSALYVLHDYRPQDDDAYKLEPVPHGRPRGRRGDGLPAGADVVRRGPGFCRSTRRIWRCSSWGRWRI